MPARCPRALVRLVAILLLAVACSAWVQPAHAAWPVNGAPLCTESHDQMSPVVVGDGAGGAVVVWSDTRDASSDIYAQRIDSTGAVLWSANGITVCSASGGQFSPAASFDFGGAIVVWEDRRNTNSDIYGQRLNAQGVPLWTFNGILLGNSGYPDIRPRLISDGSNGIAQPLGYNLLWTRERDTDDVTAMTKGFDQLGATNWGGTTGIAMSTVVADRHSEVLASDGVGTAQMRKGAVVAWEQLRSGTTTGFDIFAQRVNNVGTPQWGANGVAICDLPGSQSRPSIASVGASTTIVAWEDERDASFDIYAQKMNSSTGAQWVGNGLPVCRASGSQSSVKVASDGAGGAYLAWTDYRSGTGRTYAQRIDANGQRLWTLDGIPLTDSGANEVGPVLIAFGASGAIVAWVDGLTGTLNIRAQRVDGNGNLLWGANGVPVCSAAGNQFAPALVTGGSFNAMITWTDHRAGNFDVYVNRISGNQSTVDVARSGPDGLRLAFASANPARGDVAMRLHLPQAADVDMEVLDPSGRRVRFLRLGERLAAGAHTIRWDGADGAGAPVAAGLYFVRARAGAETRVARVVQLP